MKLIGEGMTFVFHQILLYKVSTLYKPLLTRCYDTQGPDFRPLCDMNLSWFTGEKEGQTRYGVWNDSALNNDLPNCI